MVLPGSYITDAVFIAIFAILLVPCIFDVARHGYKKKGGFVLLLLFCAIRIAGNAILIDAYKTNFSNENLIIAGSLLQGLGYSFLINAALALYSRARLIARKTLPFTFARPSQRKTTHLDATDKDSAIPDSAASLLFFGESHMISMAYIVNIAALVLTIVGYSQSNIYGPGTTSTTRLDILAQVAAIIFVVLTASLMALVIHVILRTRRSSREGSSESKLIMTSLAIALPFMLTRAIYVTYVDFDVNPLQQSLALRIVFDLVPEALAVGVLAILGVRLPREQK